MFFNDYGTFNTFNTAATITNVGAIDLDILVNSPQIYTAGGGDTQEPTITAGVNVVSFDNVTPTVITNEANGNAYMVTVLESDTAPSIAQVKLGQNQAGSAALASETLPITTGGLSLFTAVTSLTASMEYTVYIVHTDAADNDSLLDDSDFTTPPANVVLPVLTQPTANSVTVSSVIPSVFTDTAGGTLYMSMGVNPTLAPGASQIIAGTDANDVTIGSENVTPTLGENTFTQVTGLDSYTNYALYFVQEDIDSNQSSISSIGFTTLSTIPLLSSPDSSIIYGAGITPIVTIQADLGTTIYAVVVPDGNSPSKVQIANGQQSSGADAIGSSNKEITGQGITQLPSIGDLTENTNYELAFVAKNADGAYSAITTLGFLTVETFIPTIDVQVALDALIQENTIDIYSRDPYGEFGYIYYCVGNVTPYSGKAMWVKNEKGNPPSFQAQQIADVMLQDGNSDPNIL